MLKLTGLLALACSAMFGGDATGFFTLGNQIVWPHMLIEHTNRNISVISQTNSFIAIVQWRADDGATNRIEMSMTELQSLVKSLADSGLICRARDHAWTAHLHTTLEYVPDSVGCRQCVVCGAHQTKVATWE